MFWSKLFKHTPLSTPDLQRQAHGGHSPLIVAGAVADVHYKSWPIQEKTIVASNGCAAPLNSPGHQPDEVSGTFSSLVAWTRPR